MAFTADDAKVLESIRELRETEVHQRIVLPFLHSLGASHVQYLHGAFERGKDFSYSLPDGYGGQSFEVCQVKNEKFTGRATDTNSVVFALNQLLQAKKTNTLNPATNQKEIPNRAVLITTFDLPDAPLADATPLLDEVNSSCKIVGPEQLLSVLRNRLPDLYAELAFPGKGFAQAIQRYVNVHHEVTAFGLGRSKELADFFVNVGAGRSDCLLDHPCDAPDDKSPRLIELPKAECDFLESIANSIEGAVQCSPFLARRSATQSAALTSEPTDSLATSGASDEDEAVTLDRETLSRVEKDSLRIDIRNFAICVRRYVDDARAELSKRKPMTPTEIANRIRVLRTARELISRLTSPGGADESELLFYETSSAFAFPSIPPSTLLELDDHIAIAGDAGAGKTCFARSIVRAALERGLKCVYFPCARLASSDMKLSGAMAEFLCDLQAVETIEKAVQAIRTSDLVVLDGCDEAATFQTRLGQEIYDIAFSERAETVSAKTKGSPIIPRGLIEKVQYVQKNRRRVVIQTEPMSDFELDELVARNTGSAFENALRKLQKAAWPPKPRVILTSRDVTKLKLPSTFLVLNLFPFSDSQLFEFFERWCETNGAIVKSCG